MIYENLGRSDIQVSKICLGTMNFGEQNSEQEAHEQLDYALGEGINFIDTAEVYAIPPKASTQGLTERYIGSWLSKRGKRKDVILATKIVGPGDHITWMRPSLDFKPASIREALEGSLKRLQTDYIDLYQLHWPERKTNFFGRLGYEHKKDDPWNDNFHEILSCLNDLVKEGKIREVGLSNETAWAVMRTLHLSDSEKLPRIVSVQNPYNLLNRSYEVGLAEVSIREEVGLLAYSPMGFGMLSGKYHEKKDRPEDRINQFKRMNRYSGAKSWEATAQYLQIAKKYGLSLAKLSLAFVNTRPFVTSNIIGATSLSQLKENIESIHVHLSKEMVAEINAIHSDISNPAP